jgi:hypothetical protein
VSLVCTIGLLCTLGLVGSQQRRRRLGGKFCVYNRVIVYTWYSEEPAQEEEVRLKFSVYNKGCCLHLAQRGAIMLQH